MWAGELEMHRVGYPGPRQYGATLVHEDSLDRRRTDIDPDCQLIATRCQATSPPSTVAQMGVIRGQEIVRFLGQARLPDRAGGTPHNLRCPFRRPQAGEVPSPASR